MVPGKLGKLSRSVSIIGIGATPFMNINDDPDLLGLTEGDCFGYAALAAMEDAGLEPRDVDYFYHGSANPKMFNNACNPQHAGGRVVWHARPWLRPPLRGLLHRLRCP